MKRVLVISSLSLLSCITYGQVYKGQVDFSKIPPTPPHYQEEYTYDSTINVPAWNALKGGAHISFASTDQSYFRTELPALKSESGSLSQTGWRGERLNAQILVWSKDTVNQVRFVLNDLKNEKG